MRLTLVLLAFATAACDVIEQPSGLMPRWTSAYKEVISEADRVRLRDWRSAFEGALAGARGSGHAADIEREGALLDPDAALPKPKIPDGLYRCRVIKLGAKTPGLLEYVGYPAFTCRNHGGKPVAARSERRASIATRA